MSRGRHSHRKKHLDQPELTGEHKWGDLGQIIYLLLFLAVWAADSFFFKKTIFLSEYVPLFVRIPLWIMIFIISGLIAKSGLKTVFGEKRDKPGVIREGVFSLVRHPIYFSAILFYLALLMLTISLAATGLWLVIIIFYHLIALYEEKLLVEEFGDDYRRYMREVPMWIPFLKFR